MRLHSQEGRAAYSGTPRPGGKKLANEVSRVKGKALLPWRSRLVSLAHRRHADIRGAEHQADAHADEINPFPLLDRQAFGEKSHLEEPDEVERRDDDQQPAGALLPVVEKLHNLPPRCSATLARSLSPRPERLTTIR